MTDSTTTYEVLEALELPHAHPLPAWELRDLNTAEDFAVQVRYCVGSAIEDIIDAGRYLIRAKAVLPHGEFGRMFAEKMVPFSINTAQRLMAIARHPELTNPAHVQHLPAAWGTLYELTKVEPDRLHDALRYGQVRQDMRRQDVKALLPREPTPEPKAFHWLNAVGDLRMAVEKAIEDEIKNWPKDVALHVVVPHTLRELAGFIEKERTLHNKAVA